LTQKDPITNVVTPVACSNAPVIVAANGTYSCTLATALPTNTVIRIVATDPAGNASAPAATTISDASATNPITGTQSATPTVNPINNIDTVITGTATPGATVSVAGATCTNSPIVVPSSGIWTCNLFATISIGTVITVNVIESGKTNSDPAATTVSNNATTTPANPVVNPTNGTTVSGTGTPGNIIKVTDGANIPLCAPDPVVAANGTWSCVPTVLPVNGTTIKVTQTNATGITSSPTVVVVDSVVPAAPIITYPTNNSTVNTTNPVVTGSGEPNAIIKIRDENGNLVCTTLIPASGNWSCTTSVLIDGPHSLTSTQTDFAGNASNTSVTVNILTTDTDGVAASIEQAGPNNGDANGDGIKDHLQSNVVFIPDAVTGQYVVLAADPSSPCQTFNNVSANSESQNATTDSSFEYPVGFVNFESPCGTFFKLKIYWYGLDVNKSYVNRKFNMNGQVYVATSGITQSIETVNGVKVLAYTYIISDNGILDDDATTGRIKDPIGPTNISNSNGGTIIITNSNSSISSNFSSSSVTSSNQTSQSSQTFDTNNTQQPNSDGTNPSSNNNPGLISKNNQIIQEIQTSIDEAQKVIDETIRTGGFSEMSNYVPLILIIMGILLIITLPKKSQE
jgi:Bacterial Ig domain